MLFILFPVRDDRSNMWNKVLNLLMYAMNNHYNDIRNVHTRNSLISQHSNGEYDCNSAHFSYTIVGKNIANDQSSQEENTRKR